MSQFSLRHLHMGCGEPLVASWPAPGKARSKAGPTKPLAGGIKQPVQKQKGRGV